MFCALGPTVMVTLQYKPKEKSKCFVIFKNKLLYFWMKIH